MLRGKYVARIVERGIPASDCATEVVAIESGVEGFALGDHVSPDPRAEQSDRDWRPKGTLGGDV